MTEPESSRTRFRDVALVVAGSDAGAVIPRFLLVNFFLTISDSPTGYRVFMADTGTFDSAFSVLVDGKRLVVGSQIFSTQSQLHRESRPRAPPSVIGPDPFPQATNDADRPDIKAFSYPLVPSDSKPAIGEAVWSYPGRS
jgi:hypothetical protein